MKQQLFLSLLCLAIAFEAVRCDLKLVILHTNDMHSRFEETGRESGPCREGNDKCYGGFSRVKTLVDEERAKAKKNGQHPLFLNAGDTYQGSIYFNLFKAEVITELMNKMDIEVMSLGNHEFDDGPVGLAPFVAKSKSPIVCANIDVSKDKDLRNTSPGKIIPSKVLTVNGVLIGVIGYLTPDTVFLAKTGDVLLLDEVESLTKEAERLKGEGVNILIALGHSGFDMDKKIAKEVPEIDIVVGGHTNTFLWKGDTPPDIEKPDGTYPIMIDGVGGRKVPVVQAYAFTKYVGKLEVTFDDSGEIKHDETKGNPVLVDWRVNKDKTIEAALEPFTKELGSDVKKKVGTTKVFLEADATICRVRECNFGNLVTDAIVDTVREHHYVEFTDRNKTKMNAKEYKGPGWTDAPIAMTPSGSLRASINVKENDGVITYLDLRTTMPFDNTIEKLNVTGEALMAAFEHSVRKYDPVIRPGSFLQYSGVIVEYDLSQPPGERVVSAKVRCGACDSPSYTVLQPTMKYTIMTTDYLGRGGEGYTMFKEAKERQKMDFSDWGCVIEYLKKPTPIWPEVTGRINFTDLGGKRKRRGPITRSVERLNENVGIRFKDMQLAITSLRDEFSQLNLAIESLKSEKADLKRNSQPSEQASKKRKGDA